MVKGVDLESSYGYCVYPDGDQQEERVPSETLFKEKYIAIHPDYFAEIMTWKREMEDYVKKQPLYEETQ